MCKIELLSSHITSRQVQIYLKSVFVVMIEASVPGKRSSSQEQALRALTAPVDQLDTVDSGLTSCDTGWRGSVQDKCCCCCWSPRRLAGGAGQRRK